MSSSNALTVEPGKAKIGWIGEWHSIARVSPRFLLKAVTVVHPCSACEGTGIMGRWMCQHLMDAGYEATGEAAS